MGACQDTLTQTNAPAGTPPVSFAKGGAGGGGKPATRIVFTSERDEPVNVDVYSSNADGTNPVSHHRFRGVESELGTVASDARHSERGASGPRSEPSSRSIRYLPAREAMRVEVASTVLTELETHVDSTARFMGCASLPPHYPRAGSEYQRRLRR